MFDYLGNYWNNAHQICCEDSLTKGLLIIMTIASPMTLTFIQGHN